MLEELQSTHAEVAAEKPARPAAKRPVRKPPPDHLPRETQMLVPETDACPTCGGRLEALVEDVSDFLEYVSASFKVIRIVQSKCACVASSQPRPTSASATPA